MTRPNTNWNATPASLGLGDFGLLPWEQLRLRVKRGHDPYASSEPVSVPASSLPEAETGITREIRYEGWGRVPDDLLGHPRGSD